MITAESRRRGVSKEEVENSQLLVDRRPPPELLPGRPVLAPYVDNGNLLCWSPSESHKVYQALAAEMRTRGLAFKGEFVGMREAECLGLHLDGRRLFVAQPQRPSVETVLSLAYVGATRLLFGDGSAAGGRQPRELLHGGSPGAQRDVPHLASCS